MVRERAICVPERAAICRPLLIHSFLRLIADDHPLSPHRHTATLDEFGLLERLNHLAAAKYSELADTASGLESFLESAKAKYGELACFLGEIDDIHASVGELEAVVAQLDAYTKRLEARAREIES